MKKYSSYLFCLIIVFSCINSGLIAQRKTKINTHGQGTFFAQGGYNRSAYTKAKVDFTTDNYSYRLDEVLLFDNLEGEKWGSFFSSSSPQLSVKLGYFVANNWAITGGFDRYNTYFKSGQTVRLNGSFSDGDFYPFIGGVDEDIEIGPKTIYLAQEKGMNYFSVGVQRNDMLGRTKKAEFGLHLLYGVKFGGIFTKADYIFNSISNREIPSFSGWGSHAELGVRFDFYQIIFLQLGMNGGVLFQNNLKISNNDNDKARQVVGFLSPHISLGFSIFANPTNNCASCPQW